MNRNLSYDLMRVLACVAGIMVHTAGTGLLPGRDYPILTTEWYTCLAFSCLVRWCVPLFVMISGALFLDEKKEIKIDRLYGNNILRLFIILLMWTLLYGWWTNGSFFPLGLTSDHLWYLPMTIAIYMAIPVLRSIPVKMRDYFLLLWAVWLVVDFVFKIVGNNPFTEFEHLFFTGYVGYFLLGDWCNRHRDEKTISKLAVVVGACCMIILIGSSIWLSYLKGKTTTILGGYFSPLVVVLSVGVFYFCDKIADALPNWMKRCVTILSPLTLGIYLVHMEILIQIYTRVQRFVPQPIFLIPIVCGTAFVGGGIITWIIKKIPYVNKYIV